MKQTFLKRKKNGKIKHSKRVSFFLEKVWDLRTIKKPSVHYSEGRGIPMASPLHPPPGTFTGLLLVATLCIGGVAPEVQGHRSLRAGS